MAGENRAAPHVLIAELEQAAYRFDFYEALRLIECLWPDKPRLGKGVKVSDDPVRLSQEPALEFPPASLSSYTQSAASAVPRLAVNFMGLFGPHGPLPLHLTEYARERLRHHHDPTFARFADVFHHRMISLYYRAWANVRPAVSHDRPDSDRFDFYVGSMLGTSGQAFRDRDALQDHAKRFYAGLFAAQTKSPSGLRAIISEILATPVRIAEFVGEWMAIQASDQTRLGLSETVACLGQSAFLGAAVWGCQHKFRVVLGPMKLDQYLELLPGGAVLPQLVAIVRNYVGDELVWDAQLLLDSAEVPRELALGQPGTPASSCMHGAAQLGWSMWLGPRSAPTAADDLTLNPFIHAGV